MDRVPKAYSFVNRGFSFIKFAFLDAFNFARAPRHGIKAILTVSLYRNAVCLLINSGVIALLGFIFWIVVAKFYSARDLGLGSALISAAGLLSFISTLGLGSGIIRFLPITNDKARLLNSAFTISLFASIMVALIFLLGLHFWSPKLIFVRENPIFFVAFTTFVSAATLNGVMSGTFIGFRRAEFALAQGIFASVVRLLLVIAFVTIFKVFGIFASWGLALGIAFMVSLFLFLPRILDCYRPLPAFQKQVTNEMVHFSFANYIGEILQSLPAWILPLMVVNLIGAEANAYFYITWGMAGLLLTIPAMTSVSLFAEGSYEESNLGHELRKSLKMIALLLTPAITLLFLLGDKLLLFLGREYLEAGTHLLWLLLLASIPASINLVYLSILRIEKKLKEIILLTGVIASSTLVLSYSLLPHFGIIGAGKGWLISQTVVALVLCPKLGKRLIIKAAS